MNELHYVPKNKGTDQLGFIVADRHLVISNEKQATTKIFCVTVLIIHGPHTTGYFDKTDSLTG